jgi:two-component system, NtrC family, response regulator GlrR
MKRITTLETVTGSEIVQWPEPTRVLLVDDDPAFVDRAREALEPLARLRIVRSGKVALTTVSLWKPDVVLFDLLLADLDGFTFLEELSECYLDKPPFILYTTDGRGADTRVRPLPNWQVGTLVRSAGVHELRAAVRQAIRCQDPLTQRWITA